MNKPETQNEEKPNNWIPIIGCGLPLAIGLTWLIWANVYWIRFDAARAREAETAQAAVAQDPASVLEGARSARSGNGVMVTYHSTYEGGGASGMEKMFWYDVCVVMPAVLEAYPAAAWISVTQTMSFRDARGWEKNERSFEASFWRRTADTINWDGVGYLQLSDLADKYVIHPGILRQAMEEAVGRR